MRNVCILASCAMLIAAPAFAAKKKTTSKKEAATATKTESKPAATEKHKAASHDDTSVKGYGLAGCGLGSIVFGEKKGGIQIVSGLLNAIGGQTFAISTGTSNCKPGMYNFHRNAQLFIEVNKEVLAKDISRGSGETIENLSQVMGCSDSKELGGKLQQNYDLIFPKQDTSAQDASQQIFKLIKGDGALSKNCPKVG